MIAIIDYDAGNIKSVEKALISLGQDVCLTRDPKVLERADKLVLPGVGNFGVCMENLKKYGLVPVIRELTGQKKPHMGWNSIQLQNNGRLFREIPDQSYVYFVHSYYLKAEDSSIVTATAEYGVTIDASVEKDNIFATQFHPEKSSSVGLRILKNYCEL